MPAQPLMQLYLQHCNFNFPFGVAGKLYGFALPAGILASSVTKVEAVLFLEHFGGGPGSGTCGYELDINGAYFTSGSTSGGGFSLGIATSTVVVSPSGTYANPALFPFSTVEFHSNISTNIAGDYEDSSIAGCGLLVTYGAGLTVMVFPSTFVQTDFSSGFGTGSVTWVRRGGTYMPLPKLLLPPDQANYTALNGVSVLSTQLAGGASRFRADQLDPAHNVTVQWDCNQANYDYLLAFFRTAITFGADPFLIDLILDSGTLQTYSVHIVPGTFGLTSTVGLEFIVGARLELIADASYYTNDATLITAGPDM